MKRNAAERAREYRSWPSQLLQSFAGPSTLTDGGIIEQQPYSEYNCNKKAHDEFILGIWVTRNSRDIMCRLVTLWFGEIRVFFVKTGFHKQQIWVSFTQLKLNNYYENVKIYLFSISYMHEIIGLW